MESEAMEEFFSLACSHMTYLAYSHTVQDHIPRVGTAHCGLALLYPSLIKKKQTTIRNTKQPSDMPTGPSVEAIPQLRSPLIARCVSVDMN